MKVHLANRARVVLVGFEDQDNLGLRYLSSRLRQAGHESKIVTITGGHQSVLRECGERHPHIVGFSLIFQYLVPHFAELLRQLRSQGVTAHFTMGGHYASFEPAALLDVMPELDSVVRFEGEDTLLELCERLASDEPWMDILGIACRSASSVVLTPTRPGRHNLDDLPWPDRDDIRYEEQRLPVASLLGGRGCPWVCSFCSIITFYEGNGTKGRRRRDPTLVVDEIEYLYRQRGVRIILWQDDDFLAGGRVGVAWAHAIATECVRRGFNDLRWKISCRSDEITQEALAPLVRAGLSHVYMGVESGDVEDLTHLNKRLSPSVHLRAGQILRELGLSFDFGFMLLQPWSTFATVKNNLQFLRDFAGDGWTPVAFCRTLPYAGTPIKDRLSAEKRLDGRDLSADYRFLDPRLDVLYDWLLRTFGERNSSGSGTLNLLRLLLFESHLRLPGRPDDTALRTRARHLTALANRIVLDTIDAAVDHLDSDQEVSSDSVFLATLTAFYLSEDERLRRDLANLVERQPALQERLQLTR
jgi:anaerobic magnesium-protoporphyrin IX monomethyl ester cyclase